jgi:hypothetical protein
MKRIASCSCGKLSLEVLAEPLRISVCHCLACQRRTGSVFGQQARFRKEDVSAPSGPSTAYTRVAESGNSLTFHFCPSCGSTVFYLVHDMPEIIAIPVGAFADPGFPPPCISVYESRKHGWVVPPQGEGVEHFD